MDIKEFNQSIIEEFRGNHGKVGGQFAGASLLLLGTVGAKSGAERINPLAYFEDDGDIVIVASYAGADKHPPWYHNLLANPEVTVELGDERFRARAVTVPEPKRSELYARIAAQADTFAQYQQKTSRVIPLVTLSRI